ncbi:MAG: exodeoxyribonuclease V subunit gamma [Pseudomonadota bacterium]|nr:exodeoxyribonuclease V subunit gamma [Pseudomonadota bacterium]
MLRLFQSNNMRNLAVAFCENEPEMRDPFKTSTVIIQSFELRYWLQMQTARLTGISSNIDFQLPASFLWKLYRYLQPEISDLDHSPFEREQMVWRLMRILDKSHSSYQDIAIYLQQEEKRNLRLYELSNELASLFDEYLMYRPDWVLDWESSSRISTSRDEEWQVSLWREIREDLGDKSGLHRAALHNVAMNKINRDAGLPWSRLSIFGFSSMPPLQLETFHRLSELIDVDIYFLNPCHEYWGDIVSETERARRSLKAIRNKPLTDLHEDYFEIGQPILSSLGQLGRDYFELLNGIENLQTFDIFSEPSSETNLGYVKKQIFSLSYSKEKNLLKKDQQEALKSDQTIQIHCCHSKTREVEVLKDQILRALSEIEDLQPKDILVAAPNIQLYSAFIRANFKNEIPFSINSSALTDDSFFFKSVIKLLSLPDSRITGQEIIEFLEVPAIARAQRIKSDDLEKLVSWINDSGIRWEIDGESKNNNWGLPPNDWNTWKFGLDRLLMGVIMRENNGPWHGIQPLEISLADTPLLESLCRFIDNLDKLRKQINKQYPIEKWLEIVQELLEEFFDPRDSEIIAEIQTRAALEGLRSETSGADFKDEISRETFLRALRGKIEDQTSITRSTSGGITFSNLLPMRGIPYRMICILGLNQGEFPRTENVNTFDLSSGGKNNRKGDRSRDKEDKYIFLESILAAEEIFYVSYVGQSSTHNFSPTPSTIVSEWHEYLQTIFEENKLITHKLNPFDLKYFRGDNAQTFSKTWFSGVERKRYATNESKPINKQTLSVDHINLSELRAFFGHSARFFLQKRLGVYYEKEVNAIRDAEPFEIGSLDDYKISENALESLKQNEPIEDLFSQTLHTGLIPSNALGATLLKKAIRRGEAIYSAIANELESKHPIQREVTIGSFKLQVDIQNAYKKKIIQARVGRLKDRQILQDWITHLAANSIEKIETKLVHRGDKHQIRTLSLQPLEAKIAEKYLSVFLEIYQDSLKAPVFFPPKQSRALNRDLKNGKEQKVTLDKLAAEWSNEYSFSEGPDPYWNNLFDVTKAFDDEFAYLATEIWEPLEKTLANE